MKIAKIEEPNKSVYEARIEDFDTENTKGSFHAAQFTEPGNKFSVPQGHFKLTTEGKTYRCAMLVATHFVIAEEAGTLSRQNAAHA